MPVLGQAVAWQPLSVMWGVESLQLSKISETNKLYGPECTAYSSGPIIIIFYTSPSRSWKNPLTECP